VPRAKEGLRNVHEEHVAGEATVVEPVGELGRHVVGSRLGIDRHDELVLAVAEPLRHLDVPGREAAHVLADAAVIERDAGAVVRGAEVQEGAASRASRVLEAAPIPHEPAVEEEARVLRVPVTGHVEHEAALEGELDEIARGLGLRVARDHAEGQRREPDPARVDDRLPASGQASRLAREDVLQEGRRRAPLGRGDRAGVVHALAQ